jgi:hypothetical protein
MRNTCLIGAFNSIAIGTRYPDSKLRRHLQMEKVPFSDRYHGEKMTAAPLDGFSVISRKIYGLNGGVMAIDWIVTLQERRTWY